MTVGQYMLNAPLPANLKQYDRMLNKTVVNSLLTTLGKEYPNYFTAVINTWKDLGSTYAYINGNTISVADLNINRSYRDKILKATMPTLKKLAPLKQIEGLRRMIDKINKAEKASAKDNNMYKMINAGSMTKSVQVHQMLSMPPLQKDVHGQDVVIPVLKSYGEGLDTAGYYSTMYGVRRGTVDRSVNTQDTGALNKALLNVTRRLLITEEDCGTRKGIDLPTLDKNILDRFALETVAGVIKRNDIIDGKVLLKLKSKGIKEITVRSPLTCKAVQGVCQRCYGLLPNGSIAPVGTNVGVLESQAITERATQLVMQTFHTGGVTQVGAVAGFPRLLQVLKVPEKLGNKATLSSVKGIIKKIQKNSIGGHEVRIEGYGIVNDKDFIIPPGRVPIVVVGQKVNVGDAISDGVIKPQELGELKDHLAAQNYLTDEASKIYGGNFFRKTFETVIRGISDNAVITSAPDKSGFLRGDRTSISYIKDINKDRKKQGMDLIKFNPYFKSVDTANVDAED
jgi:DNA-directed RNA polymerase subunit beta'